MTKFINYTFEKKFFFSNIFHRTNTLMSQRLPQAVCRIICAHCALDPSSGMVYTCTSSRIFENVTTKWTLYVQHFFPAKVAITKTRNATIAFSPLLLSSFSLLSFSFVSALVSVILVLIAPISLPFDAVSLK